MKNIILSAGHHPGAQGAHWRELTEHQVATVWIARMSETILRTLAVEPKANLFGIEPSGLTKKVNSVNKIVDTDDGIPPSDCIAVELHFNSAGTVMVEGCETLYCPGSVSGQKLADKIHTRFMADALPYVKRDRGIKEGWYRQDRPGIVDYAGDVDGDETPAYWLRKTKCPAIILEPAFMCQIYNMIQEDQMKLADCMAYAIMGAIDIIE